MCSRNELEFQDIKPRSNSSCLIWSEWSKASLLNYLNVIDCSLKHTTSIAIPWFDIPAYEEDVLRFCKSTIYSSYKMYFTNKIESEDSCNILSSLARFIRVCDMYDICSDGDEASQLYCDILNSLFDKGCKDPTIFLMLWNRICGKTEKGRIAVFDSLIKRHRNSRSAEILGYVLRIAKEARFDFWGAWNKEHSLNDFHFCPVTAALLTGNVEQLTVLLQYGFQQNCQRRYTYDKHFQISINSTYSWLRTPLVEWTSKRRKTLTEILLFLEHLSSCTSSKKRVLLYKCFKLLWDTVQEPLPTSKELLEEVKTRFLSPPELIQPTSCSPLTRKNPLVMFCSFYEQLNSEAVSVLQPRSLQHLCKCNVRDVLQRTMNLPDGINELPIPSTLKLYLNVT